MRPAALALALFPAHAEPAAFDISILGLPAGSLEVSGEAASARYSASGELRSGGLLRLVKPFRYEAHTEGRVTAGRLVPERYEEWGRRGDRRTHTFVAYENGVPGPRVSDPPREPDSDAVDPATQGGTLDLLTAVWRLLRDVPRDEACRFTAEMFDGEKRSRITTGEPVAQGDAIACAGEYRRLGGFSPEELAEKQAFPFRMTYLPGPDGLMRVERVEMDTLFGPGVMTRR